MKWITADECRTRLKQDNLQLIDIREPWEHEVCNIDALHIPMDQVASELSGKDASANYVIVCKSGNRAQAVANLLETELSFQHVYILEGGIVAWMKSIDPTYETY